MSIINYASREIQFKIVYYGPALCGKTTNLGYIHKLINPENHADLTHIATATGTTPYLQYVLNNRKKRVQSFEVVSSTGQNVFASLNAVSQILLHKFSKQSDVSKSSPAPVAIPVEPPVAKV